MNDRKQKLLDARAAYVAACNAADAAYDDAYDAYEASIAIDALESEGE